MHHLPPAHAPHRHQFGLDTTIAERRTRLVVGITATMMVVEIVTGLACHSMALLADGWHMSTHVAAFLIAALAYYFSRRHAQDPQYSFGTGKMGVLGGFTSAVLLAVVALLMAVESVHRFLAPLPIYFDQAIVVAVIGLLVNLLCAFLLKDDGPSPHHGHRHGDQDLNRRSAYVHVLADALTSITAIVALVAGKYFAWNWLDPAMGLVGSVMVSLWAYGLLRDTSGILLDRTPASCDLPEEIHRAMGSEPDTAVTDLHVWQVSEGKFAAIVSLVAAQPKPVEAYRALLSQHEECVHLTVEVQQHPQPQP